MSPPPPLPLSPSASPASAPAADHDQRALSRGVRAFSGVTLLSRVGGLVRDVVVGRIFGDGALNSAFQAAFAVPNMFRRLFGEGALSAAFIPEYTAALKEDRGEADRLASLTVFTLGVVTAAVTVAIEAALLAVLVLAPGGPERQLLIKLVMVMLPFMPLICVVAILAGLLQVHGRFGASASGPLILNTFIVAVGGYFMLSGRHAGPPVAYALGVATTLSAATQLWWFLRLLRPYVTWTRDTGAARPRARRMLRKFVPVAVGLGTLQLNTFLDVVIATYPFWFAAGVAPTLLGFVYPLDTASNGILALTGRLYQFPLGVFGIAVATAAFPMLSRHADDPARFLETLRRGLRLSLFIGLPATGGLILVRHDATALLFGYGRLGWSADGLARSALVLAGFAPGVWAYSLNQVLTRAFYARGDTATPMRVSMAMVALNVALNLTLIWPAREAGLAWATSVTAVVQCAVLAVLARRRLLGGAPLVDAATRVAALKIVAAAAVMTGLVLLVMWALPARTSWGAHAVALAAATGAGGLGYAAACRALRAPELGWVLRR